MAVTSAQPGIRLLSPLAAPRPATAKAAPRLATLDGKVLGLLNNSKPNADRLLARLHARLAERYALAGVVQVRKDTSTRPAPVAILAALAGADFVLTAVGD